MRTAKPALACRGAQRPDLNERGFTLIEFMIAAALTAIVLGSTVMLATQIQQAYGTQLDDATVEQEARYALEWIARDLRSAGSDPYSIIPPEQEVWLYPNGGADCDASISGQQGDSIRVQADINPPDGDILDPLENVTIAFDAANNVITRQDSNDPDDATAVAMTEAIITDLCFTHLNSARAATADSKVVAYVQVQVTAQSRGRNLYTGEFTRSTLATEVRLRTR
jgi:prepilin-type N-terminal cleavage/methylation domain-containing protein